MARSNNADPTDSKRDNDKSSGTPRSEVRLLANVVAMATRPGVRPARLPPRPVAPRPPMKAPPRQTTMVASDTGRDASTTETKPSASIPEVTTFYRPNLEQMPVRRTDPPPAQGLRDGDPPSERKTLEAIGPVSESSHSDSGTRSVHDEQTRTYSLEEISRLSEEADEDAAPEPIRGDSSGLEGESSTDEDITVAYYRTSHPVEYCEPHTPPPPQAPGLDDPFAPQPPLPATTTMRAPQPEADIWTERRVRLGPRWVLHAAWISTAVVLGVVGFAMTPTGEAWIRDTKAYLVEAPAPAEHMDARAVTPVPASIGLSVAVTPKEAKLYLDGEPIGNPAELERPQDTGTHELRAEAAGHRTVTRAVRFERDLSVVLELAPLQEEPVSTAAPAAPPPVVVRAAVRPRVRPPAVPKASPAPKAAAGPLPEVHEVSESAADEAAPAPVEEPSGSEPAPDAVPVE